MSRVYTITNKNTNERTFVRAKTRTTAMTVAAEMNNTIRVSTQDDLIGVDPRLIHDAIMTTDTDQQGELPPIPPVVNNVI